jgi:thiamine-monophosphate kinase
MAQFEHKSPRITEHALIAALRKRARMRSPDLQLGIGDDCAIVRPKSNEEIVITTDFSLEGVHFRREWHTPESVGHRCLARGLSDLAAMGARPVAALLSLAVPNDLVAARRGKKTWLDSFLDGFFSLARQYKVPLAGGDTAQSLDRACFDIVLLGAVKRGRALLRSAAKVGDAIFVTGALGGAAAELLALAHTRQRFPIMASAQSGHPHLFPEPRLNVARKLVAMRGIHAAIDVSDGLSTDLAHICEESGLAAELEAAAIPVHSLATEAQRKGWVSSALDLALNGGEDYELLFTASADVKIPRRIAGVEVRRIGRIVLRRVRRARISLRDEDGRVTVLEAGGWEHFSGT